MTLTRRAVLQGLATLPLWPGALRAATRLRDQGPAIPYVDGLCFLPEDLGEFAKADLCACLCDVSSGTMIEGPDGTPAFQRTLEETLHRMVAARRRLAGSGHAWLATQAGDLDRVRQGGPAAVMFQVQGGGEIVGERVERLDVLHEMGLRVFQMTHHFNNPLAGGALEPSPTGLTDKGREALAHMEGLRMLPDLSHASIPTSLDVLGAATRPVLVSHGAARALCDNPRCLPDEVIRGVGESGGVFGIFMMSFWLTEEDPPEVEHYVRQIRHVVDVAGIEAVGIANDYPLSGEATALQFNNDNAQVAPRYHPWWTSIRERGVEGYEELPRHVVIPELNHIQRLRRIHRALEAAGFSADQVARIMGGNWLRVFRAALS